MESKEVI